MTDEHAELWVVLAGCVLPCEMIWPGVLRHYIRCKLGSFTVDPNRLFRSERSAVDSAPRVRALAALGGSYCSLNWRPSAGRHGPLTGGRNSDAL